MFKSCCVCVSKKNAKDPQIKLDPEEKKMDLSPKGASDSDSKENDAKITSDESSKSDRQKTAKDVTIKFKCEDTSGGDDENSEYDDDYAIEKFTASVDSGGPCSEDTVKDDNANDDNSESEISDYVAESYHPPPVRRKSSTGGILKRPSVVDKPACDELSKRVAGVRLDVSDDEVFRPSGGYLEGERLMLRKRSLPAGVLGAAVGRDELALKRHRIFSELVGAARAAAEHKVHFDPLEISITGEREKKPSRQNVAPELEDLIGRLESVVLRLERIAPAIPELNAVLNSNSPDLESPRTPIDNIQGFSPTTAMSLAAYQEIIDGPLERFVQSSANMQHVQDQVNLVKQLFNTQLQYLIMASKSSAPTNQNALIEQMKGHTQGIEGIQKMREANKTSPNFTHLSAISESIPALGWICVKPAPSPYIKEMNEVGKYYTNRILKDNKGNQQQTNWCVSWTETLGALEAFVKQYHTTGLVWGGSGAGACPPPPPPCPPPCMPPPPDFESDASNDERSALFAQINQGADITKTLKRVTSEMQTHKNPTLREGPAPFKAPPIAPKPFAKNLPGPGAVTQVAAKAPKAPIFNRDGKKWFIEHQVDNNTLLVENAEMNNVVYMFSCRNSTLTVKGKVNSIVLDSCTKCSVVFENLVSSIEFVNCQSVQMQVLGKVPTISIDKTDGCQMYLSPDSLEVEIISSKCTEMNVLVPKGDGDYTELAVAEQFKTTLRKPYTSLSTIAVEKMG